VPKVYYENLEKKPKLSRSKKFKDFINVHVNISNLDF
jgi:hypothetical protein